MMIVIADIGFFAPRTTGGNWNRSHWICECANLQSSESNATADAEKDKNQLQILTT